MTDAPARTRPAPLVGEVVRTERLAATMVRVVVGGPGLAAFEPSPHADSYVKVVFLPAGTDRPRRDDGRLDLDAVRASLPPEQQPRQRSYTVRAWDPVARELTLDFVVHGDEGIAGPWAASAQPGDEVLLVGPGGAWSPDPDAASYLFAGDASALPAIAVALERLPADAVGHAVIEVHGPRGRDPAGLARRACRCAGCTRASRWPAWRSSTPSRRSRTLPAPVSAFVHGEAGAVRELRRHVRAERGITREQLSVSGYWRLGADDEGWRATKRDWLATIEESEAAQGLD